MTKKEFKTHIQTKWGYYLLSIIAAFIISLLAVSMTSYPKKNERVTFFLSCYSSGAALTEYMDSIKPEYLEMIDLYTMNVGFEYYGTAIKGYREDSDIIIVPESQIDYIILNQCLTLNDDIVDSFTTKDFDFYSKDSVNYGIKIYSKDTKTGILSDLVVFNDPSLEEEEDYYLFIINTSLHLGEYNDSEYTGAIDIIKGILNYENQESE